MSIISIFLFIRGIPGGAYDYKIINNLISYVLQDVKHSAGRVCYLKLTFSILLIIAAVPAVTGTAYVYLG